MLNAVELSSEIKISRGRRRTGRVGINSWDRHTHDLWIAGKINSKVLTLSITQEEQFRINHYLHFNREKGVRCVPVCLGFPLALASSSSWRIGGWRASTTQFFCSHRWRGFGSATNTSLSRYCRVVSIRRWWQ